MNRYFIRELDYPDTHSLVKGNSGVMCPDCYSKETQYYIPHGWACYNCHYSWEWCEGQVTCPNCNEWRNIKDWHCSDCGIDFSKEDTTKYKEVTIE